MLFIQIVQALLLMSIDYSTSPLLGIIANTELFFPLLLGGLMLVVELGFRLRQASPGVDAERQSLVESARGELTVLLGLLLGFSLPMALPHYEHRNQLVVDEAGALITVHERAQLLPEPFRGDVLSTLAKYVAVRVEFGDAGPNEAAVRDSVKQAEQLQREMWEATTRLVQQKPNAVTPIFVQALDVLPDLLEQRLAAEEKRIPAAIWLVVIMIAALTCFVVGYSMRERFFLGMLVVPLTVAIVLSLASELDNPRTGLVHDGQQSLQRLYLDLGTAPMPGR
jgi:peptidoglycan/LPS O-acetylase OafA/YrhL